MGIRIGDTPLDLRTQDDYNALAAQNEASLVRGLRSGTYSAGGQLRALAGGVGEALGANAFATGQYARAKELGLRAQEEAPLVSNYKDINSLGSLGSYLAGKLGQAGPSLAAGLGAMALTDGAAIPALLAATAGNAPLEIGSAIQRQQEDPVARQHSALARLGLAGGEGVASSALQNIVPVAMGGKLLGRVAENVGNQSLKQILARNVGEAVVGNAVAGGAAERLHQGAAGVLNPNRDTSGDAEAVKDAMIEGGLTGLPFAAAGAGGEAMHGNTDKISQGVRDAAGSVKDRLSPARRQPGGEAAPEAGAGPEVPPNGPTPSMYSFDLFGKKRQRDVDLAQKMAADQETVDPSVAGAGPAAQDKAFADDLKMRADKAMQWVQDIINDPTTLPEAKQQAMEWAQNITDRASQVGIAGLKLAQEKTRAATQAVNSFADRVSEQWGDLVERGKTIDPLRNQQADRLDQSVIETIVPMLQDKHPGLLDNQQAVAQLGDALRKQIVAIAEGDNRMFDKRASDHLYEIFGDDIHTVYDQLFETFSPTLKPQQRERVLGAINDMVAKEQERMPLRDVVMKNLRPELQGTVTTSQARAAADMLGRYTRGELTDPKATPAEHARNERLIRQQLESYFGGRTDAVLKVAEKQNKPVKTAAVGKDDVAGLETENAGKQYSGEGDAREHTLETQTADERLDEPTYYGTGKERNKPFLNESANTELYGNAGATKRVLDQARADHPGQHVEVIPLEQHLRERGLPKTEVSKLIGKEDPANYSMVKVHPGERSDTHLSPDEVSGMYLDAKNHGDSKARIDTDGKRSLDAHAIVKTMLAKFKREGAYSEGDDKGYLHMVARAFHEGIGSYIEHRANETAAKEVNRWAHAALENPDVHHMTKAKLRRLLDSNEPTARDVLAKMYEADTGDKAADAVRGADGLFPGLKRDKNGRPVFPDDLVLQFKKGGNSITYGDIKGLEYSPARGEHEGAVGADRTPAQLQRSLDKVQMRMADIKAAAEKLGKPDNPVDQQRMDELYAKWDDLRRAERGLQEALDKRADAEHAQSLKDAEGRSAVGKDENIHRATLEHGEDVAVRKDEAGNTLTYANSTKKAELGIESLKTRFKAVAEHGTAPQKALANKALALLDHFDQLPDAAAKAIVAMKDAKKFSEVADTINRLYEKYGEGLPGKSEAHLTKYARGDEPSWHGVEDVKEHLSLDTQRKMENAVRNTLGDIVKVVWGDMNDAGVLASFNPLATQRKPFAIKPTITFYYHLLKESNGVLIAHHEAAHAVVSTLYAQYGRDITKRIIDLADKEYIRGQIEELDPHMAAYVLSSPEELFVHAYGLWAVGELKLKGQPYLVRVFNRIKQFFGRLTEDDMLATVFNEMKQGGVRDLPRFFNQRAALEHLDDKGFTLREWQTPDPEQIRELRGLLGKYKDFAYEGMPRDKYLAMVEVVKRPSWKPHMKEIFEDYLGGADAWRASGEPEAQFSKQAVSAGPGMSPAEIKQVGEYIDKVLGKSVERYISGTMQHSGEFFRKEGQDHLGNRVVRDVIRISTHAFDPMSVAAHESFHAFFEKLRDTGNHEVMQALYRAANSVEVMDQLRGLLKGDRNALRQIDESMEERTAYMYQFWANGALNVNPKTKSVFTRIANMVKHALGIWTDGEHAQHIMEYFHRGDYVPNMHDRSVVAKALMEPSTNRAVEAFKSMAKPLIDMHNSILATGDQRMRKLENPALTRIADLVYREHAAVGQDQGYVPAWTQKRLQVLNKFIDGLNGVDSAHFAGAIEALQQNLPGRSPQERKTIAAVRNTLDHMFQYLRDSGLNIGDMGAGKNYFPRMWDSDSIRGNPNAFELMLLKNGVEAKAAQKIVEKLTAEVDPDILMSATGVPAFHSGNERVLRDLPDAEVAPFLKKDLIHTMNTYITQAVRRAEYVKRFGEDGKKLAQMLRIAKERYGASDGDLEMARKYIAGVDGTLGNNISPGLNKLFGNIQVYQNIRLLPLAIFSSVIDPGGIIVRGGTVGDAFRAFKRGIMEVPRGFKDNPKNDYWTDIAETIGAIESKALLHAIGSQQSVGLGASAAKLNNLFFKINLMEQFNQSMRVAATEAAARFITKHNDGKASPHSERWLTELGMRAGDAKTDAGGNLLITRQQFIDAGYSQAEAEKRSIQMGKAVNKWVDGAILRPNEAHKAIWMNDPHWRLVAHLKQFVFAFQHAMIDRVLEEAKYGNYKPAAAITSFVPVMMASDMLRGMLTNGGQLPAYQQDWDAEDFLWNGVQRAGLLGVGQFRADMFKSIRRGGDGIGALSGPTIEQLTDGIRAIGGGDAGGTVMKALPANALYSHYLGHSGDGGPMFMD